MTSNKYRSLEHIINDVLLKETVGILGTDRFQGNAYATGRNKGQQAKAQPYGDFEGGGPSDIKLPGKKMSVPTAPAPARPDPRDVSKAPKQPSRVPDQGDAATSAATSAAGAAQEGGKKRIKEGTDTNVDLIKKGSMLNRGPLTQFTNPQNAPGTQTAGQPKPQLSFQTPDLSGGKKEDEIQTPKLNGKGDAKSDARAKSQPGATAKNVSKPTSDTVTKAADPNAPQSVLNKAEKTVNTILGTSGTKAVPVPASSGAGAAPAKAAPTSGVAATTKVLDRISPTSAPAQQSSKGDPNADFPAQALAPHKFNDQQQATPPVSPGGGMAGNTPKGTKSPSMENPSAPSKGSSPLDVVGKGPGEVTKIASANDGKSGGIQHVPPTVDHKSLPLTRASQTVPLMRNPPLPMVTPTVAAAAPATDKPLPAPHQGGADTATVPSTVPGAVATTDIQKDLNKGDETIKKGLDQREKEQKAAPQEPAQKKPPEYDSWSPEQKKKFDDLPTVGPTTTGNPTLDRALDIAQDILGIAPLGLPGKLAKKGIELGRPWGELPKSGGPKVGEAPKAGEPKAGEPTKKPGEKSAATPEQQKERQGRFSSEKPEETDTKPKVDQPKSAKEKPASPEKAQERQGRFSSEKPEETDTKPKIDQRSERPARTPEQAEKKQGKFRSEKPEETPKSKIDQEPRTKTEPKPEEKKPGEETKPEEKKPGEETKPEEGKGKEEKPVEKEKHTWRDKLGWAGLGGLGAHLLKYLHGVASGVGGDGDAKHGRFMYGKQGQISGTPTRQKGGSANDLEKLVKNMKEESEGTRLRRAVELVGRRKGTNKKKSSLARQSAVKTRIIDEDRYLQIVREAIKEKQDKDKKLKPGTHTTPVDIKPKLAPEPTDQLRQ